MGNQEPENRKIIPQRTDSNFFQGLVVELRLVLRMLSDRRVNFLLKLLPLGSLVYLLFPDLLLGPIDDTVIVGVGVYLFIELCPDEVVAEHRAALRGETQEETHTAGETIEGKFTEVDE